MYIYARALEAALSTVFIVWLWAWLQTRRKRNGNNVLDIKSWVLILEQSNFLAIIMHSQSII
jgi:hypothetical protein